MAAHIRLTSILVGALLFGIAAGFLGWRQYGRLYREKCAVDARMRAIMAAAIDAVIMMDSEGRVSHWSKAAERILGYTEAEAVGQDLHALIVPAGCHPLHAAAFLEFQRTGQGNALGQMLRLAARRKDGDEIPVVLHLSSIQIGDQWHAVGILRDGTDDTQGEEELRRSKMELEQYAAALESSNRAIEEFYQVAESATQAKSQFLANMSHELRTPMTAVLGFADLALAEGISCAAREHIVVIKRNGSHLLELINDILDLSKVEAGKMEIERIRCSPSELLADVVSLMRVRADAKHLRLRGDPIGLVPETVLVDPLRLRQVLVNLVGNAIKFTDDGEVRIVMQLTDEQGCPQLRFDVIDTGIGMNEEQVGRLFQAFAQVDSSATRKFSGSGLGLCISKRLVEIMGGSINVQSMPGKGSTFSVTIALGPLNGIRMIEADGTANASAAPIPAPASAAKIRLHARVLLAEDGLDNQRLISLLLRKAGAHVEAFENGAVAIDAALIACDAGEPFDIILMDMQMPVMDGYEATQRLRKMNYTGPIIALTANAMSQDRQQCLDVGCDDYLPKPIDQRSMLETIVKYLPDRDEDEAEADQMACSCGFQSAGTG